MSALTLLNTDSIQAKAGTGGGAITYTIAAADEITSGSDVFKIIGQGSLTTSVASLYSPGGATKSAIIQQITLANTTSSPVTGCALYVNGTASTNSISGTFTIPANGTAIWNGKGLNIYGSDGIVLTTIGGAAGGDLTGSYPNPTITTNAVTYAKSAQATANTLTGNNTGSTANKTDIAIAASRIVGRTASSVVKDMTGTETTALLDNATFLLPGLQTASEKIAQNSIDGRTSTGTNPRVFRPGDYMVGNTYDPTGSSDSTSSFAAMMTAARAWNDRYVIEIPPGVWKIAPGTLSDFGTNNTSVTIRGSGRGNCILLPSTAPTGFQSMITLNRGTTGGDSITIRGFTIYNTSGTVYTAGSGILTNGADAIDIQEVAFIDMYRDIQVSGQPYTMTTAGTTALTGISPVISAADTGQTISGPGIVPGTTITFVSSTTATLSQAATTSTTEVRYLNNSIKVSMQHIVNFNTNAGAANTSVAIYVNNGQAGDTYIGPDIVMSDGGGSTRRRACVELVETGHYEITQCNLTGSQTGILIDPGASQSVAFGFHTNVLCDSNQVNGMLMDTLATTSSVKNIKSVNSWYSGTVNGGAPFNVGAAGVKTQATAAGTLNGITHTSDRFLNNRTHGYEHGAGADFRWSDADMKGNSQTGSASADGLNVAANVGNFSVNGGKYGGTDAAPTGGNQRYGINVAAGTGDFIKIAPDSLNGNVTGPLSFGATGLNNFINGCPGLASPYTRGASSSAITTVITIANMLIPKNSVRVGTTYKLTARGQHSGAATAPTFTCRIGTTNDAVGSAATNAVIVSAVDITAAANQWTTIEFYLTITAIGGSGNIQGSGFGTTAVAAGTAGRAYGTALAARASGAGFLAVDTTADKYLTLALVAGVAGVTVYNATIEVVNY